MPTKLFFKKDIFIIAILLMAALFLFFFFKGDAGRFYEVSVGGKTVVKESLFENTVISLENGVVIECHEGRVYFSASDCPDKICKNSGKLSEVGEWAACLPNETLVKVVED